MGKCVFGLRNEPNVLKVVHKRGVWWIMDWISFKSQEVLLTAKKLLLRCQKLYRYGGNPRCLNVSVLLHKALRR